MLLYTVHLAGVGSSLFLHLPHGIIDLISDSSESPSIPSLVPCLAPPLAIEFSDHHHMDLSVSDFYKKDNNNNTNPKSKSKGKKKKKQKEARAMKSMSPRFGFPYRVTERDLSLGRTSFVIIAHLPSYHILPNSRIPGPVPFKKKIE
jgi:hypothetical protein